ncbi:NlpC/P60 family protein [Ginsengibacter hankyongi]|uniref:NlpC/P60 family protein n=1 Tax=Ginsengibacter hankyongi TaxID=2607284 RepID=A0A5J5IQ72_9BACT|nr:C40 family peptidase [Ginsengibacter hankyongi]KAA9042147.1 NlpC/P60 family protein [Ginsengibacter hankyongi]
MRKKISMCMMITFFCIPVYMRCNNNFSNTNSVAGDTVNNTRVITGDSVIIKPAILVAHGPVAVPAKILGNARIDSIVEFAKTLIGTRYLFGSADPLHGFDCSGFITYVFNHFRIIVPRSSIGFTNIGKEISSADSEKGDVILFTGTDSAERFVGHIGIIISNENGNIQFIHSSSGKANGVVITVLNDYYRRRFVKVVRLSTSETRPSSGKDKMEPL